MGRDRVEISSDKSMKMNKLVVDNIDFIEEDDEDGFACFDSEAISKAKAVKTQKSQQHSVRGQFTELEGPALLGEYKVMTSKLSILINVYLPVVLQYEPWKLLYSLYTHGAAFETFYRNVEVTEKLIITKILLIKYY